MWIAQLIIQSLCARRKNNISLFLSAASIAAGVLSVMVVIGVMNGLQDVLIKNLIRIDSYEYSGVFPRPLSFSQIKTQLEKIRNIEGIKVAVPFVDEFALISTDTGSSVAHVRAIHSDAAQKDADFTSIMQRSTSRAGLTRGFIKRGSIHLGWALAVRLGVYRGDVIRVTLPGEGVGFRPSTLTLVISDVFYTASHYDSTWAFISLFDYAQSVASVNAKREQNTGAVSVSEKTKERRLARVRFGLRMKKSKRALQTVQSVLDNVRSWQENNRSFYFALKTEKTLLALLAAIIFVVIALHFRFAMRRRIGVKRDDIVSLRTMGATPQNICMWFLGESTCIGMFGIGVGLSLGFGVFFAYPKIVSVLQKRLDIRTPFEEISIGFVHVSEVITIILCTGAIIMITAYFAVRHVTKITPIEVLHHE